MNFNFLSEVPRCDRIHKSAGFPTAVIFLNLVVAAVTWDKGARADACSENAGDTSTNLPPKKEVKESGRPVGVRVCDTFMHQVRTDMQTSRLCSEVDSAQAWFV